MTPLKWLYLFLAGILLISPDAQSSTDQVQPSPNRPQRFQDPSQFYDRGRADYSSLRLPVAFEANLGQADPEVCFIARSGGMTAFFTDTDVFMVFRQSKRSEEPMHNQEASLGVTQASMRMRLLHARKPQKMIGLEELPGVTSYLVGNDTRKWLTNIPTYRRVEYRGVYPGIDIVFYGEHGHLEYDLVVAPGADPGVVEFSLEGARKIQVKPGGDMALHTNLGGLIFRKPFIYQELDGIRQEIAGDYVLRGNNQVAFRVEAYDSSLPLVIDPVLDYSTFLGRSGGDNESGRAIALDSAGNAYITGISSTIPETPGSAQITPRGGANAFVAKLNATGTALLYSTYLGGSYGATGLGIAVDSSGNAYLTGVTYSRDFPITQGAFQKSYGGDGPDLNGDAFVAKLNSTGRLVYSTYLGGRDSDWGYGIAVDSAGNAYVAGRTCSDNFPTTQGGFQRNYGGGASGCGARDAFVAKFNTTGTDLVYSTYLGGDDQDVAFGIAVDAAGNAYVTGRTQAATFPFTGSLTGSCHERGNYAGFVTKLSAMGVSLIYSMCLDDAAGNSITVDSEGNAYVTGTAGSSSFYTTPGAFRGKGEDFGVFVMKLNPAGKVLYSTGLGPAESPVIAADSSGNAYIAGYTYYSESFPVTSDSFHVDPGGSACAFIAKLNASGTGLLYSTLFDGFSTGTAALGIAADSWGNAYITGYSGAREFPATWGAFRTVGAGTFVAKFADPPAAGALSIRSAASFFTGSAVAPGSIATGFGQGLASTTESAASVPLPTSLAGTKVSIKDSGGEDRPATIYYVSPGQINYLIPDATAVGPGVVTVTSGDRQVASGHVLIGDIGPGVFTANGDGRGVAAAVAVTVGADGSQTSQPAYRCGAAPGSCVSVPIDLGGEKDQVILSLFGTGLRRAKQISFSRLPPVTVLFVGAQGQYPGLDQVNFRLARSLIGRGEMEIRLVADGRDANIVTINIK